MRSRGSQPRKRSPLLRVLESRDDEVSVTHLQLRVRGDDVDVIRLDAQRLAHLHDGHRGRARQDFRELAFVIRRQMQDRYIRDAAVRRRVLEEAAQEP